MQFKVKNRLEFSAVILGKYNVIVGDSAIGKTTLYNFLHEAEDGIIGYSAEVDGVYHVLEKRAGEREIAEYQDTLLVLDEDCRLLHLESTASVLRNSNNKFLIISRVIPRFLPLGVSNLLTISQEGMEYTLVPVYHKKDARKFCNVSTIITEDSDAGFEYFKSNFEQLCISSSGNGNLVKVLQESGASRETLAVFDSAGIIPVAKKLYRYLKRHGVQYLDWDSFEAYVLTQAPICESMDYDSKEESVEQYASKRLAKLLGYQKNKLPDCLRYGVGCSYCDLNCGFAGEKFSKDLEIDGEAGKSSVFGG